MNTCTIVMLVQNFEKQTDKARVKQIQVQYKKE